jgi:hypothetical protein
MTGHGTDASPAIHLEVAGPLDVDVLESLIGSPIPRSRSGCAELVLELNALTDFPTRLFSDLHRLDQTARLHRVPPATARLGRGRRDRALHEPRRRDGSD